MAETQTLKLKWGHRADYWTFADANHWSYCEAWQSDLRRIDDARATYSARVMVSGSMLWIATGDFLSMSDAQLAAESALKQLFTDALQPFSD